MLKLLERNIEAIDSRLMLIAPQGAAHTSPFGRVHVDTTVHDRLLRDVQRMRGTVYLEDGAVQPHQLSWDGRHQTPEDERSWHLLFMTESKVTACAWYLPHAETATFGDTRARKSPLASDPEWQDKLWHAVESDLALARAEGLHYAEVGGWAVAKESRCTSEGLLLALAAYSLGRAFGGAIGMTTATVRHASSAILRRLGGEHLQCHGEGIPAYFDGKYGCTMELLRFDSRRPEAKYAPLVALLHQKLSHVAVIAASEQPAFTVPETAALEWDRMAA